MNLEQKVTERPKYRVARETMFVIQNIHSSLSNTPEKACVAAWGTGSLIFIDGGIAD